MSLKTILTDTEKLAIAGAREAYDDLSPVAKAMFARVVAAEQAADRMHPLLPVLISFALGVALTLAAVMAFTAP